MMSEKETLEKEIKKLIQEIYLNCKELNKDKRIPIKSRINISMIESNAMHLWIKAVKKQSWGAVSGDEITKEIK